jgi:hypothetical protein
VTRDGSPVVQGPLDPAPGFYVSTTSLEDRGQSKDSPLRYVNSSRIPYVVVPPSVLKQGVKLGDFAVVQKGGRTAFAIVADVGPEKKLGEGSIALADALGIASNPRKGGARSGIDYVLFPGSGNGKPRTRDEIELEGARLVEEHHCHP